MRISRTTFAANARSLALLSLVLGAPSLCSAGLITYNVNLLMMNDGSATGFIETDGTVGVLAAGDVLDWNLLLYGGLTMGGSDTFDLLGPLSGSNSETAVVGSALSATATQLLFDFSTVSAYLEFSGPGGYLCIESSTGFLPCWPAGESLHVSGGGGGDTGTLSGTGVIGTASSTPSTPEPSTLALLGAGTALLVLRRPAIKRAGVVCRGSFRPGTRAGRRC